jgi:hypothetical protein
MTGVGLRMLVEIGQHSDSLLPVGGHLQHDTMTGSGMHADRPIEPPSAPPNADLFDPAQHDTIEGVLPPGQARPPSRNSESLLHGGDGSTGLRQRDGLEAMSTARLRAQGQRNDGANRRRIGSLSTR